ncbi:MAG: reverse transcriptase domain-containing protein, partial [Gammaproteobacteria bacterium]|nr:reverse transcriptase domain-containing protein [Gammaproteobacteria bacterium]
MATYGQIQEFCPENETIEAYLERVELYFEANNISEDKRVAVFLSVIGGRNYTLLRNLLAPQKLSERTLADLADALKKHFGPKRIVIAERFRFHRREQAAGETVADYEAELRRLAIHCQFGEYLDQALRDRLVCGLKSEATQRRLLSEPDLTLKRAIEVAQSMEAAERNTQQLKGGEASVNSIESATVSDRKGEECYRCGRRNHSYRECRFKDAECHNCGRKGHIARMCRSKRAVAKGRGPKKQVSGGRQKTQWVQADRDSESAEDSPDDFVVYRIGDCAARPITAQLEINGKQLTMEVDTGAAVSIISESTQKKVFSKVSLQRTSVKLRTYTDEPISVLGEMRVIVTYRQSTHNLTLYVVPGNGPSLLGRNWLQHIRLDWRSLGIATVQEVLSPVNALLKKYATVFQDDSTTMRPFKATLQLKSGAVPRFHRPRPVPFALKEAVGQELDRMEAAGVLESVSHSNWAAPIVPVPKKDGQIRICGDFKVTVNPVLQVDQYPLPKPDDLFTTLVGGKKFTKLDLKHAYQQMQLEENVKELVTINTHKGLYQFTRLPFGIASAPALFQRAMDTILQGIPHVLCYIDDILITGRTEEEHLHNLEEVLKRLQHHGLQLKVAKCAFLQDSVEYLGHTVDKKGLHTMLQKVEAVKLAPVPKNQQQLRSFLGLVHYYGK